MAALALVRSNGQGDSSRMMNEHTQQIIEKPLIELGSIQGQSDAEGQALSQGPSESIQ